MKKQFVVASCHPQQVEREIDLDGKPTKVLVDAVVTQLVPSVEDGSGSIKVVVPADDAAAFEAGKVVDVTFSIGE